MKRRARASKSKENRVLLCVGAKKSNTTYLMFDIRISEVLVAMVTFSRGNFFIKHNEAWFSRTDPVFRPKGQGVKNYRIARFPIGHEKNF